MSNKPIKGLTLIFKRMLKISNGVTLLLIVVLLSAFIPNLYAYQVQTSSAEKDGYNTNGMDSLQLFNSMYLSVIGYKSAQAAQFNEESKPGSREAVGFYTVSDNGRLSNIYVTSKLQMMTRNLTIDNYHYEATFVLSNGSRYSINECQFTKTINGQTEKTMKTEITGTFNLSLSVIYRTIEINDIAEKHINATITFSNATNRYNIAGNGVSTWDIAQTRMINGTITLNQNMIGKSGTYKIDYGEIPNETFVKVNITRPDGTMTDPWTYFIFDVNFPFILYGFTVSWLQEDFNIPDGILIAVGLIIQAFASIPTLIGQLIDVVGGEMYQADQYVSDMGGYPVITFYTELATCLNAPLVWEMGFYTNQVWGNNQGDWYFWPTLGYFPYFWPHTCQWPNPFPDPPLTILAYDESSNTFFEGVPFYAEGNHIGDSSSTIDFGTGTYTFEVPDYNGLFAYFDVGGTPIYDNPATITIGDEDVTVTAHYSAIPTVTLTVNAYDAYLGEYYPLEANVYIDNNWVGTTPLQVQLPMGNEYAFSVDYTVYDPYWPAWDVPIYGFTGDFNGYNINYNTMTIAMFSESTVNAGYTQWQ
jgi:hypothetical protein